MRWPDDLGGWPNAETSRRVDLAPYRFHLQEAGPPDAPAMLLLHGAGGATHSWRDVLMPLAAHYRVLAPDLPGHGFSTLGAAALSGLGPMTRAVDGLCAALGRSPEILVGHSAGAAIALRLALDRQARGDPPAAVIGINPALADFDGIAGWLFPMAAKALAATPFAATLLMAGGSARDRTRRLIEGTGSDLDAAGIAAYARLFSDRAHVDGVLQMMARWSLGGLRRDLGRLDVPCLFLLGGRDRAVPPDTIRKLPAMPPDTRVETCPEAGHLLHEEQPARFVASVEAFLNGLPAHRPATADNAT